jgi:hypothetical protein
MAARWKAPDLSEEYRLAHWDEYADKRMREMARASRRMLTLMRELERHCQEPHRKGAPLVRSPRYVEALGNIERLIKLEREAA